MWTVPTVKEEAAKHCSRAEFRVSAKGAFNYAYYHGLLDELFPIKSNAEWDKVSVTAEALKYTNRNQFREGSPRAYRYAVNNHILTELFPDISFTRWSRSKVMVEASKYETRQDFRKGSPGAFKCAQRNQLLDNMFPPTPLLFNEALNAAGIYILYAADEVVYIGKSSTCIRGRLMYHYATKVFTKVDVLIIPNTTDLHIIEVYHIGMYRPAYNVDCVSTSKPSVTMNGIDEAIVTKYTYDNIPNYKDI